VIRKDHENYKVLKSDLKYEGHIINLRLDDVRFPNNKVFLREIIEHKGAVGIIPVCSDGKVIMVKQYRHPVGGFLLEIPAGLFHPGESAQECAIRELKEETGAVATKFHKLAEFYTTPGYSNEKLHLYLALVDRETSPQPEEDELLEIEKIDFKEAYDLIAKGEIQDSKTIIGLCLASNLVKQ